MQNTLTDIKGNKYNNVYTIKPYEPSNWYTSKGAFKHYLSYEKRGIPNTQNWRFITLTVNPNNYYNAQEAYEICNRHIRQFLYLLRQKYGNFEFMKKLEFHKSGYPHWHLLVGITHKIDLNLVRSLWGKGRIDVERIKPNNKNKCLDYLFKYACKKQDLPDWVGSKTRFRFVAFSKNFFNISVRSRPVLSGSESEENEIMETQKYQQISILERLEKWGRTVLISIKKPSMPTIYVKAELNISSYSEIHEELCRIKELETQENSQIIRLINKVQFENPIYLYHLMSQWLLDIPQKYVHFTSVIRKRYLEWDLLEVA